LLLLASLVLSAALAVLERLAGGTWTAADELLAMGAPAIAFGVIALLFAVIYKVLPDAPLSWRDAWVGAAFTAALFSVGKWAIGLYLGNSALASSFGAAGSLVALLLWVYYSAQIFFLGAQFTREYALAFGSLRPREAPASLRPIATSGIRPARLHQGAAEPSGRSEGERAALYVR
jgi:membrane protein